jgi:AraC-like DNA-binding protein
LTFEEQAAELAKLETLAQDRGMSEDTFNRIAMEVMQDAHRSSLERSPAQVLGEIRRRIEPPGMRKPGAL